MNLLLEVVGFFGVLLCGVVIGWRVVRRPMTRDQERLWEGALRAVMDELLVAAAQGRQSVRLPVELAFRICGIDPKRDWFKNERRKVAKWLLGDRIRAQFEAINGAPNYVDTATLHRFAAEAMHYVELLEDELAVLKKVDQPAEQEGIV